MITLSGEMVCSTVKVNVMAVTGFEPLSPGSPTQLFPHSHALFIHRRPFHLRTVWYNEDVPLVTHTGYTYLLLIKISCMTVSGRGISRVGLGQITGIMCQGSTVSKNIRYKN